MASGAAVSCGAHKVFVYGSLLEDEVVRALLTRVPTSSSATLHNYHRYSIKGRVYPAILPIESKKVTGRVFSGITDVELDTLDIFEDVEYERWTVEVTLIDSLEKLNAFAYVWVNKDDPDLYGSWDFDEWKAEHMKDFVEMTKSFMTEIEQPEHQTRVATYESYFAEG